MDITAIEKELRALLSLTARWTEQGYTPTIEKDIALGRIRTIYDALMGVNAKPAESQIETPETAETAEIQIETPETPEIQPEVNEYQKAEEVEEQEETEQEEIEEEEDGEGDGEDEEEQEDGEDGEDEGDVEEEDEDDIEEDEDEEKIDAHHNFHQDFEQERQKRFIHDLFCNDEGFYHQEIGKMAQLDNLDDVLIYIGQKYAWSPDNESAQQFVELQAKRFGL